MENNTTTHVAPAPRTQDGYYALIPIVLVTLAGCALAMVLYFKRKSRSDELRHRLIPMYTYDPEEQDDDDLEYGNGQNEEELREPLHKYGRLSMDSDYGTDEYKHGQR